MGPHGWGFRDLYPPIGCPPTGWGFQFLYTPLNGSPTSCQELNEYLNGMPRAQWGVGYSMGSKLLNEE